MQAVLLDGTVVGCQGGYMDGVTCYNDEVTSSRCDKNGNPITRTQTGSLGVIIAALESGSLTQVNATIATFQAQVAPPADGQAAASPNGAADDDRERDKGKGKKGGKGRR